jgi:hypothetical protein
MDAYRALDGIKPSRKDGGVLAGLAQRYGPDLVRRVLDEDGPSLVAADAPLLMLATRCKKAAKDRPRPDRPSVAEIARRDERDVH